MRSSAIDAGTPCVGTVARRTTGISSARRTSSGGSTTRGSDHCDSKPSADRIGDVRHLLDRRDQRRGRGRSDRGRRTGGVAGEQSVLDRRQKAVHATLLRQRRRDEPVGRRARTARRDDRRAVPARCRCTAEAGALRRAHAASWRAVRGVRASHDRCCIRRRRRTIAARLASRDRATARARAFPPTSRSIAESFASAGRASPAPSRAAHRWRSAHSGR